MKKYEVDDFVVSAAEEALKPLLKLTGKGERYRKRGNGKFEMCADVLSQPKYLCMWHVAGVDTDIFYSWGRNIVLKKQRVCVAMTESLY